MDVRVTAAPKGPPRPPAAPDVAFARLKDLIMARTGHFYYQDKDDALWERVRRRLQATGCRDCTAYLDRLDDAARGPSEWAALEAEVTIGETFFFRYAEQFAALRRTILPDLVERNRSRRRLRIWSAGCATGAEPYSVAITLKDLLGEEAGSWRLSIVGTDINEGSLAAARRGRFGKWALRAVPLEERQRWFLPAAGGAGWVLRPEYRSLVRFERHNLMSLVDGTSPLQFTDYDLVLCRNVLIYFHPAAVTRIVGELGRCLVEGGWLLVGHAEPNPALAGALTPVSLPGTVAYRRLDDPREAVLPDRAGTPDALAPAQSWRPLPLPEPLPVPPATGSGDGAARERSSRAPANPRPTGSARAGEAADAPPGVAAVKERADTGDLDGARALCRESLLADPLDARLHFYDGVIAQALGRSSEAEEAFRKALYLDKAFVMAHYHLGLLLLQSGRRNPGRRSIATAAGLASALADDAELPDGDGMTAAALRGNARLMLGGAAGCPSRKASS